MGFINNSELPRVNCGDIIPGSSGDVTVAFGPGGHFDKAPFWFGWYGCKKGDELKRWKNTETWVGYYVVQGEFEILSEGETKKCGPGEWISFPPQTDYEVKATGEGESILLWVYYPPKAG